MRRKPLAWKLFPVYFLITLASVLIVVLYALSGLRDFYHSQVEAGLETNARVIGRWISDRGAFPGNVAALDADVKSLGKCCGARITVILPSGKAVADSEYEPAQMENHRGRAEFKRALVGRIGRSRRMSATLGIAMIYVAIPLERDGKVIGAVRISLAADAIDARPAALYSHVFLGTLVIAVLAGIVSLLAARRVSRPLRDMRDAAARLAEGDLDSRISPPDTDELGGLADTLNQMAAQIGRHVRTITQQSGEQQAILSSMSEGVVAIDNDDRLILLNPSAERFLGVMLAESRGRTIQEAIRNPGIQRFLKQASEDGPVSTELTLHTPEERMVQAVGTALVDAEGMRIGALAVLSDVTQMRRLEHVRRDFVANASHELRTPITSIRASLETLTKSSVEDPQKAREFLDIAARQAARLHAIVDDLLMLSQIEERGDTSEIPMERTSVCTLLQSAVADFQARAEESGVELSVTCDELLEAKANPALLRQAVANLLDNAIKYSPGGSVALTAERVSDQLAIRVADTGCGIEPDHIPRLFERFYRVDKARSRKLGGTGLGLAIVKHIVQAHGGRIEVESKPGQGSAFTIVLP